jgi:hypothetical protein
VTRRTRESCWPVSRLPRERFTPRRIPLIHSRSVSPRPVAFLPFPRSTVAHPGTEVPRPTRHTCSSPPKPTRQPHLTMTTTRRTALRPRATPAGLRTDEAPVHAAPKRRTDPHVIGSDPHAEAHEPHGTIGLPQQPKPPAPYRLPGGTLHAASATPCDANAAPITHSTHREANFPPAEPGPSSPTSPTRWGPAFRPGYVENREKHTDAWLLLKWRLPVTPFSAASAERSTSRPSSTDESVPLTFRFQNQKGLSFLGFHSPPRSYSTSVAAQPSRLRSPLHRLLAEARTRPRPWDGPWQRIALGSSAGIPRAVGKNASPHSGSHRCERLRPPKLPKTPPPESVRW